jgi:hypothetical protein
LGEWLGESLFWYGIVAPVVLLVILTIYLFWLNRKARTVYEFGTFYSILSDIAHVSPVALRH